MSDQLTLSSESIELTTTTSEEIRAILNKCDDNAKSDTVSEEKSVIQESPLEEAQRAHIEYSGKAQFYPEIVPTTTCSMSASEAEALEDARFGYRGGDDESTIRVTVPSREAPSVFATAVDENVILAAKERQRKALGGVRLENEVDNERPVFVTVREVITKRAKEHYQAGLELVDQKNYCAAIVKFNKAINLRSDIIDFYTQRGECYLQICDFQSAILNLKRACCLDPENTELYQHLSFIYFFQGQCLFDELQYEQALEAFTRAAEMCPEENGYQTRIISCLAALQRHGECLNMINKRLDVDKNNPDLYVMRARLHELFRNKVQFYNIAVVDGLKQFGGRRAYALSSVTLCAYDIRDALTIDPNHTEALRLQRKMKDKSVENKNTAVQLMALGKDKEALQKISVAIEMEPGEAQYHVLRGALHRRLGDFNAAIDDYLLALDKTDHAESSETYQDAQRQLLLTYNDFAVECFNKGFYEEAVILLNKAIKGEKSEKGLYINRGDCFFKQGDLQFARADYEQAHEMDPSDQSIKTRLSVVEHEFGVLDYQDKQYNDAEKRFTSAIAKNPHVGRFYISRSRARYMLEDHDAARFDILTALLLDPTNEELISITSRLFPGRSIRDVLASPQANDARHLLDLANGTNSSQRKKGSSLDSKSVSSKRTTSPNSDRRRKASPLRKREPLFPDLAGCMQEWQFNLTIIEEKKIIKNSIKHVLHERKTLKYQGARVCSMPSAEELKKFTKPSLVKAVKF